MCVVEVEVTLGKMSTEKIPFDFCKEQFQLWDRMFTNSYTGWDHEYTPEDEHGT